jgi:hypothetical protein
MAMKKILILAASPKDTPRLRLDQEVREIDNGLQRARRRDEFVLKQVWAVRSSDVRRAILDFEPNMVHFCGHGAGDEGIAFEDDTGNSQLITAEALAGFFELFADKVECVVLNACYSEVQANAIAQHINYVIGMKMGISDTAAIEFSVAFYDALGAGRNVEFAYKLACNAILWAGLPEHLTPVLKTKEKSSEKPPEKHPLTATSISGRRLREFIVAKFNLDEIETVCVDIQDSLATDGINLQVGLAMVAGSDKVSKVRELIKYLDNRGYLAYLIQAVQKARPEFTL